MNPRKKKILIPILAGILIITGIALSVAFMASDPKADQTEAELLNVIKEADQIRDDSVPLPMDLLKENLKNGAATIITEDQAQQLIGEKDAENEYLSESTKNNMLSSMQSNLDYYYTKYSFDNAPNLDLPVGMGTFDYNIIKTSIDGETATVELTKVGWLISVERNAEKENDYYIWMIFNKDYCTDTLVQKDGSWVLNTETMSKEGPSDDYNYDKGHYDTIEEALDAAAKLDPAVENPFK